jgi:hypothetical protein
LDIKFEFRTVILPEGQATQVVPAEIFDLPQNQPVNVLLSVLFRKAQRWVEVKASSYGARALEVRQLSDTFVQADVLHGSTTAEAQCTVTCLASGESRTGPHACIECKTDGGTVKICC